MAAVSIEQRRHEFEAVLLQASRAPHPKLPYGELPTADLLEVSLYDRLIIHQLSYMILLRSFSAGLGKGLLPEKLIRNEGLSTQDICDWGRQLTEQTLFEAYCLYPDAALIRLMADTKMEEVIIGGEVAKRLEHNPAGQAFFLLSSFYNEDWSQEDREQQVSNLSRALNVDTLKRYASWERTTKEIEADALTEAFAVWRVHETLQAEGTPLPPFPVPQEKLLPAELEFWTGTLSQSWTPHRKAFVTQTAAILDVATDTLRKKVRNHVKTKSDTGKMRDRISAGKARFPKFTGQHKDPERAARAEWDWAERARKGRQEEIGMVFPTKTDSCFDAVERANERDYLYRVAQKRWGAKAVKFLQALSEGRDKQTAAVKAGISRPTGDKYLKVLRTTCLKKNLSN
jgi:hypothetical protein